MKYNLDHKNPIKKENLCYEFYFQTLLQEAYRVNLINDTELEEIQLDTVNLLSKKTNQYNSGDSSSIRAETAETILLSICYTIGIYLKTFSSIQESIEELKKTSVLRLYENGKICINKKINEAKQLFEKLLKTSFPTKNYAYRSTLTEGIPSFFASYDVDFGAHETPASIDYILSDAMISETGIEYIVEYLKRFLLENEVCQRFDANNIHFMMQGYNTDYENLLINIFDQVMANSLACFLVKKNIFGLNITPVDRECLQKQLQLLSKGELVLVLKQTAELLLTSLSVSENTLKTYIIHAAQNIAPRLKCALEINTLSALFVTPRDDTTEQGFQFKDSAKMDDESYRKFTNELRNCRFMCDKITMIHKQIHSFADLLDLLKSDCFFSSEFLELFHSLDDATLVLIYKKIIMHTEKTDFYLTEAEKELHIWFTRFLSELNSKRHKEIKEKALRINME